MIAKNALTNLKLFLEYLLILSNSNVNIRNIFYKIEIYNCV